MLRLIGRGVLLLLLTLDFEFSTCFAQSTAFSYQGRLAEGANPAAGIYDLRFVLYDAPTNGNAVGGPVTNAPTTVGNGAFGVTLDFGAAVFNGVARWLEIGVRTNGDSGAFQTLSPRQQILSVPYAIRAANFSGEVSDAQLSGNIARLDRPNAFASRLAAPALGSVGALDLFAGGMRVLRLEPDQGVSSAGNLIGGYIGNSISPNSFSGGNTIAGGGSSGGPNSILDNSRGNFIGAGSGNQIGPNVNDSVIGGGFGNIIYASRSMVVGGYSNLVDFNADSSFAAGYSAQALHPGSFVWADNHFGNSFASTAPWQFSVRASGGVRLVTTGAGMTLDGPINADVQIGAGSGDYRHLQLGGGNSSGFLYGSYPRWGDGIHFGYNYYADAIGGTHFGNTGGGTSRITVGYNHIVLATGPAGVQPAYENVQIDGTTTTVNGTFNNNSDRQAKQNLTPISPARILDQVAQLALSEWSYKEDAATRHIGPMAQDFHSAFQVGTDEKHIAPMDEGGVALAAIQGLNQKLEEKLEQQEAEIAELKARLHRLERLVHSTNGDAK